MFASKPGLKYLLHEAELRQVQIGQIAKKAEQGNKSVAGAILSKIGNELLSTVKLVGSTVGQVAVDGTGTHFLKGFRTDTYLKPASDPNNPDGPTAFARFFGAGGLEGAPLALEGKSIGEGNMTGNVTTQLLNRNASSFDYLGDVFIDQNETPNSSATYIQKLDSRKTTKNGPVKKETRINLGDQGARDDSNKKQNVYWEAGGDLVRDNINFLDVFDSVNGSKPDGDRTGRDLIKFRFHVITPDSSRILYFRAFLDSFADNYSGQWNPVKYLGRAEDFQIYSGFQRKISLSFKIAAATRIEMRPLYEKIIWLASATAPTYASGGQFMRGTITKITVGDYIYEQPGVLNSVNYTWNVEYPWEIAMTQPEQLGKDDFEQELPMVLDCQIDFTPIHTFTPVTGLKSYITTKTTEGGNAGLTDINNVNTGIEPVPTIAATDKVNASNTNIPPLLLAPTPAPAFGPQLPA